MLVETVTTLARTLTEDSANQIVAPNNSQIAVNDRYVAWHTVKQQIVFPLNLSRFGNVIGHLCHMRDVAMLVSDRHHVDDVVCRVPVLVYSTLVVRVDAAVPKTLGRSTIMTYVGSPLVDFIAVLVLTHAKDFAKTVI
jgi:hypothetical protein